jgi:ABC-2 type transport system ATP-binding protein
LSPSDLALFLSRNPDIDKITVPTLLIHGTVDTLFSLAEADATAQTLLANGVTTKVIWFCGGHGICANNLFDLSDGAVIERETLAWLDRYVKKDLTADTGPQFEWVDQRGQWFSSATYPVTKGAPVVATTDSQGMLPLIPYLGGSGVPFVPYALPAVNAVSLKVPASTTTTYLVGAPTLTLTYSGTGSARHVYAQLVDNQTGMVLGSLVTPVPVTLDGETHTITVDLEPVAHTLRPGESVTLQLVSSAGLYETIVPSFGTLTVSSMQISVPTADPTAVSSSSERRSATAMA